MVGRILYSLERAFNAEKRQVGGTCRDRLGSELFMKFTMD